jgi:hypothetical protein
VNEAEHHARSTLEAEGFRVQPVPRSKTRTADFLVEDGTSTYLVEVTGKEEGEFLRNLRTAARRHGVSDDSRGISPDNTLDSIIRRKARQLADTRVDADFRVLWMAALHDDWPFLSELLYRTLYGYTSVYAVRSSRDQGEILPCLYYNYFSFYRERHLDALVLSTRDAGCLYANELTLRAADFRDSRLYNLFDNKSRRDPYGAPDGVLRVAPEVDRSQHNAQWQYLKDRYGVMTSVVVECHWQGMMVV